MPLSADFTRKSQRVDHSLLSGLDFTESETTFETELEVVAEDLEDLLV